MARGFKSLPIKDLKSIRHVWEETGKFSLRTLRSPR
jgi:hypothetical protein